VLRRLSGIPEAELRRVRLLAWMLVTLIALALLSLIVVFVVDPAGSTRRTEYTLLIALVIPTLIVALTFDLLGWYRAAALVSVACAMIAPWGAVWLDPNVLAGDVVPLLYVSVPIVLSGVLLSAGVTAVVAAVQIAALGLIAALTPESHGLNWPSLLILVLFIAALSVVANLVNQQDLAQISRQNRQLEESEALLREQSVRDHLTTLFNRRYLEETLRREVRRAERDGTEIAVIMLDIDGFKRFNDDYGHHTGDAVLREMGAFLRSQVREADIACRYGGEEFTLIMPGASAKTAGERAERVRTRAKALRTEVQGQALAALTVSLGVAMYPHDGADAEALLAASDAALYRAKTAGRDRVVLAST
jgi:diguanylate cyclase (GGDEF)-like protein